MKSSIFSFIEFLTLLVVFVSAVLSVEDASVLFFEVERRLREASRSNKLSKGREEKKRKRDMYAYCMKILRLSSLVAKIQKREVLLECKDGLKIYSWRRIGRGGAISY